MLLRFHAQVEETDKDAEAVPTGPPPTVSLLAYLGCFMDHSSSRHYDYQFIDDSMTIDKCLAYCNKLGKNLVWGLRLWQAEQALVWEHYLYWLELSALKIAMFADAYIKFLEETFWNNNQTSAKERYQKLVTASNHKSWMSPWAQSFM